MKKEQKLAAEAAAAAAANATPSPAESTPATPSNTVTSPTPAKPEPIQLPAATAPLKLALADPAASPPVPVKSVDHLPVASPTTNGSATPATPGTEQKGKAAGDEDDADRKKEMEDGDAEAGKNLLQTTESKVIEKKYSIDTLLKLKDVSHCAKPPPLLPARSLARSLEGGFKRMKLFRRIITVCHTKIKISDQNHSNPNRTESLCTPSASTD